MKKFIFQSLSWIFVFSFFLPNAIAYDACSNAKYSTSLSSTNLTYDYSGNVFWNNRGYNYDTFYISVLEAGTVTVTVSNPNGGDARFTESNSNCPNFNYPYHKSKTYTFSTPSDFNLYVDAYSPQNSLAYNIHIVFTPDAAKANDDNYLTWVGSMLSLNSASGVLNNDSGANLNVTFNTNPSHGTLTLNSDGSFDYMPNSGYTGADSFTYTITDGSNNSDTANVFIDVTDYIETTGGRDFIIRHQESLLGSVAVIGNTVICKLSNGQCVEPPVNVTNDEVNLQKIPENYSTLSLPSQAEIKYARLYWQGRKTDYNNWSANSKTSAKSIKIKYENGGWQSYSANILDIQYNTLNIGTYSASADVTSFVSLNGAGKYYIDANSFYTMTGATWYDSGYRDGLGAYGAWVLVVVYKDPNETTTRNITIFDGYKFIDGSNPVEISVNGFLTPKQNPISSTVYTFVAEGDKYIRGDDLLMAGINSNTTYTSIAPSSSNAFDSRIDVPASRTPNLINNEGIDIQKYDVGTTSGAKGIIGINETGAKFNFTTGGDVYFPSLIIFSTELYQPKICYDYTYGQNGHFVTATDIGNPEINGTFDKTQPIDVKLYFENKENSDVVFTNLTVKIDPIDTAEASYKRESTYVLKPNSSFTHVPDSGRETADAYDRDVAIGTVGSLEYFYMYYGLDINKSTVALPINATLTYNLSVAINGQTVNLTNQSRNINQMDACQQGFGYEPVPGIFNVVHNAQTKAADPYYYFNLPTQVVGRTGNYKVESMDPLDINKSKGIASVVAVEMVDAAGFRYVTATCTDENATVVSDRVWVVFENNASYLSDLNKVEIANARFFDTAIQNAAFRLSYNMADGNGSVLDLNTTTITSGPDAGTKVYNVTNFTEVIAYNNGNCAQDMDGNPNSVDKIPQWCSNAGLAGASAMTKSQLDDCMECIYGLNTKRLCSRDNFAIRPEAFSLALIDQNQTNSSSKSFIIDNNTSTPPTVDLAAGYKYLLDVNATNHKNIAATFGYSTNIDNNFTWSPIGSVHCNDDSNGTINVNVYNGNGESNISKNQVGKYLLNITDSEWTTVDHNIIYMGHHEAPYFQTGAGTDCLVNDNITQNESNSSLNGCNISSSHTNHEYSQLYTDIDLVFHPYKFDLNTSGLAMTPSIGLANSAITATSYIYMADINNSEEMSYHLNGYIRASGYDDSNLTNFIGGCYGKPIDINITKNINANNTLAYQYRFYTQDKNNVIISTTPTTSPGDLNNTTGPVQFTLNEGNFTDLNGSINSNLNLNFFREVNSSKNPRVVEFGTYRVDCSVPSDCNFSANLTTQTTNGTLVLDHNITHIYGRTNVPRSRFMAPVGTTGTPGQTFLYYETFCNGTDSSGIDCNTTLIPGTNLNTTDDPRWFKNVEHNSSFGVPGIVTPKSTITPAVVTVTTQATGTHPDFVRLEYDGTRGYPYKATMENNASSWLIYNKYNNNANTSEFDVEFVNTGTWTGENNTTVTTKNRSSVITNRRSMW